MNVNVPSCAACTPLLTGASRYVAPRSANSRASARLNAGPMVLVSSTKVPGRTDDESPSAPLMTISTSVGLGRLVMMFGQSAATCDGVERICAPRRASSAQAFGFTSQTAKRWPASSRRRPIGPPILPTPMNPMSIQRPNSSGRPPAPARGILIRPQRVAFGLRTAGWLPPLPSDEGARWRCRPAGAFPAAAPPAGWPRA